MRKLKLKILIFFLLSYLLDRAEIPTQIYVNEICNVHFSLLFILNTAAMKSTETCSKKSILLSKNNSVLEVLLRYGWEFISSSEDRTRFREYAILKLSVKIQVVVRSLLKSGEHKVAEGTEARTGNHVGLVYWVPEEEYGLGLEK